MSKFELQPATPSVKEIFDTFQVEFYNIIDYGFGDLKQRYWIKEAFQSAKTATIKLFEEEKCQN